MAQSRGKASYLLLFFISILLASLLRSFGDGFVKHISAFGACNNDHCFGNQAVYRTTIFFGIMMLLTCASEREFHSGCWCLKVPMFLILFVGSFFISNDFYNHYASTARIFAALFIIFQIVILIDVSYQVHEYLSEKIYASEHEAETREALLHDDNAFSSSSGSPTVWKGIYLGIALSCVLTSLIGIGLMYKYYGDCTIGTVFVTITLISCVLSTLISVSNLTNIGLMTPALINAYSVFLCWQALSSHPDETCNPSAGVLNTTDSSTTSVVLAAFTLTWTSWRMSSSTKSLFTLKDDNIEDEDVDEKNEDKERLNALLTGDQSVEPTKRLPVSTESPCWQFHLIMMFGSLYMAMALTAWGSADGETPSHSRDASLTSVWVKIASQWITIVLYIWTVVAPYVLTNREFTN